MFPSQYMGLLGLLPVAIGIKKLFELFQKGEASDQPVVARSGGNIFAVAAVTIANGGDNVGIYTPLFATSDPSEIAVIGITFALMTGIWVVGSHWMVSHPTAGAPIRRYGPRVVPFVLIALGILIMYEADSYRLFAT